MRSAVVLAGLLVLAGCQGETENLLESVSETADETPSPAATSVPTGQTFQALGTEPFWSIEVLGDKLLYTSPEQQTPVAIAAHMEGMSKHGAGELRYVGRMDGKAVVLTIALGICSDGMSDTVYAYTATFTWGERTEQGCARLK